MTEPHPPHAWQHRPRPTRLERRYAFADYSATREFLDATAELCERFGHYPDLSFGRTYVNATLSLGEDEGLPKDEVHRLAAAMDDLAVTMDQQTPSNPHALGPEEASS